MPVITGWKPVPLRRIGTVPGWELSNIELGKITFDMKPVEVGEVARTVASTLEPKAKTKGIALEVKIEKGIQVLADMDRLVQVLLNLVDNGIKFTEKGSVKIEAQLTPPIPLFNKEGGRGRS